MNFIVTASTDVGLKKETNQDSFTVKVVNTPIGKVTFAVLCDGMGGLQKGEVASASVVKAFSEWLFPDFPHLCSQEIEDSAIRMQWENIIEEQNRIIMNHGNQQGVRLGTTVTVLLMTESRYFIMNVGDTRAYEISHEFKQLTVDQTVVAREIALGNLTEEEAKVDPRRSVLLQCIGASKEVYPDMFFGDTKYNAVYMLCSDGFRHEIIPEEIFSLLHPSVLHSTEDMKRNADYLIEVNKQRNEQDNISVILIRTF